MKKILVFLFVFTSTSFFNDDFLTISIVRNDGILIPFIRFENLNWKCLLNKPNELNYHENYVNAWYFTSNAGEKTILEKGTKIAFDNDTPSPKYGYLTNYRDLVKAAPIRFASIAGIATNYKFPIISIQRLTNENKRERLTKYIISELEINNIDVVSIIKSAKQFKGDLLDIQSAEYFKIDTVVYYYVEVGKDLSDGNVCSYFFKSFYWISEINDEYNIMYNEKTFDDCDYKMVSCIGRKAYGAFKFNEKYYVVIINGGWDGLEYILAEFQSGKYNEIYSPNY